MLGRVSIALLPLLVFGLLGKVSIDISFGLLLPFFFIALTFDRILHYRLAVLLLLLPSVVHFRLLHS